MHDPEGERATPDQHSTFNTQILLKRRAIVQSHMGSCQGTKAYFDRANSTEKHEDAGDDIERGRVAHMRRLS